jgi:integrase
MGRKSAAPAQLTESQHVDGVTVRPWKPGKVQLDFPLPDGSRPRPIIKAPDTYAALQAAKDVATCLDAQRRGIAVEDPMEVVARLQGRKTRRTDVLAIGAAIECAITHGSQARPEWKHELRLNADLFTTWLKANRAQMANDWAALDYGAVQEYVGTLAHLSSDRATHRLAPIRLAAMYWTRQKPHLYHDITAGVRMPEGKPKGAIVTLSPAQVPKFLEHVQNLQPSLYPLAALSIYAGLRVYESAHLRACDVDLKAGTIRVTDTETHTPKNKGSYRTLPVGSHALAVLKSAPQPIAKEAALFLTPSGLPWVKKRLDDAWKRFLRALDKHNETLEEAKRFTIPEGFTMRGGRRTFSTLARKGGANRVLLQCYLGHAAADVLGQHYDAVDATDLATVPAAFELGFCGNVLSTASSTGR